MCTHTLSFTSNPVRLRYHPINCACAVENAKRLRESQNELALKLKVAGPTHH